MPLAHDVRFALRQLRKSPAFTLIVLATLALCIGANTAIFSVLDAVLLQSAPYPEPERLAQVVTYIRGNRGQDIRDAQNGALFEGVRDGVPALDIGILSGSSGVNFAANGRAEFVRQQRVSAGLFHILGIPPRMGREFTREEDVKGGPALAILSDVFWKRTFNGDPAALGKTINLRGEPYTVIGVMPADFRPTGRVDIWTPLRPSRTGEGGGSNYRVIGRLKPGVTWSTAEEQLAAISPGLTPVAQVGKGASIRQGIIPIEEGYTRDSSREILITWAAVLTVLLIGCVNIAGLLLARAGARSREIATRLALGGSRSVIVRQLLIESLILALGGGVLGIGVGALALGWLKDLGAADFAVWRPITIDVRVMAAMIGVAALTSVIFGLLPAISTSRIDLRSVLVEGGRGNSGGRRRWGRQALVICEVALSLVLLVGAGLLVRTLAYLNSQRPGFDPRNVLSAAASLQDARYTTSDAVARLFTESLARIRNTPGVENAAVALTLPYERPLNDGFRLLEGDDTEAHVVETVWATAGYFETMRIPVLAGRPFRETDLTNSAPVAIVSEAFARRFMKGQNPIGRHLGPAKAPREIVGVVGDVQQHSGIGNFGPISLEPTLYIPYSQTGDAALPTIHTWFSPKWVVRSSASPGNLAAKVQSAVASADPLLPVAKFQTIADLRDNRTSSQRYHAALFSILAGLALLLAAIGLYGMIAHSIMQRKRELGIRLALGATAGQAMANAMKPGIVLAVAGVVAGALLSLPAVQLLKGFLWGVQPSDPVTFVTTGILLLAVALLASLIPALRILRLDPANTLRSE